METNNTITEDYVSYETAQLLKQKGFAVPVRTFYNPKYRGEKVSDGTALINYNADPEDGSVLCSAPTLQMACKWLREVHKLHIRTSVFTDYADDADGNTVDEWCFWDYMIFPTSGGKAIYEHQEEVTGYGVEPDTCEGAQEAAIKYCLTNLID